MNPKPLLDRKDRRADTLVVHEHQFISLYINEREVWLIKNASIG